MRFLLAFASVFLLIVSTLYGQGNLLSKKYTQEDLNTHLVLDRSWLDYPAYKDREGWEASISEPLRMVYIETGEAYLGFDWPQVKATDYLAFVRSGSRVIMQNPFSEKRKAFQALFMAELMEGEGRFIDDLVNGIWDLSEMTYWGLSAHLYLQEAGFGIPDVEEPTIDLNVGQIAAELALAHHFFHESFEEISPLINRRIKKEVREKMLEPYYERDDFWWMGLNTSRQRMNNWTVWCNYNALITILLMEENPNKRKEGVFKTMVSVDRFLDAYEDDGGCDEGPSYWSHAGGKLYDYLNLLDRATQGKVDVYGEEKIANIGRYIYRAFIADRYFINFADASNRVATRAGEIFRFGKKIEDDTMMGFGAYVARQQEYGSKPLTGKIELALENLLHMEELLEYEEEAPYLGSVWLPDTGLAAAREKEGSKEGFYFAAKGGHNAESHNHNDVGTFILYMDGKPALVDAGVGTYTAQTFSDRRYEIWTMQSEYHNLPVINGLGQKNGLQYSAKSVDFEENNRRKRFTVDISNAYPDEAGVDTWLRTYSLRPGKEFLIENDFRLQKTEGETLQHFITACKVSNDGEGRLTLTGDGFKLEMQFDPNLFEVSTNPIKMDDERLQTAWPDGLERIALVYRSPKSRGKDTITIKRLE
ncbi:heparinase II/III domain-containing protein [Pleomorphovibrio marinus]|uniref:heparinase II/III domain-containing protein n=1 Tax=Pleomorphovibrio marinus TaxID=2164132 RepID=UPI000E0B2D64|nr:heparinase II/III family protein [Pleomorphovibrio marinus]